jgi:chromosome segregation ATPase
MATSTLNRTTNESEATTAQARLDEHRTALAAIRGECDQAEAAIDELLIAQGIGQKIDVKRLEMLEHRRDELSRKIKQTVRIVDGLQAQVHTWDAEVARRRFDAALDEMHQLSARAFDVEAAYHDAAAALVSLGNELSAIRRRFDELSHMVARYQPNQAQPRQPNRPYEVPASLVRSQDPEAWAIFLRDWKETHR